MPTDLRTFIRVHDGMPDHPKIEALSDAAFRLLVETWCWCSKNRTDGRVPAASWKKRGTARARKELIDVGLAHHGETAGDVEMHDYLKHQRSAAEIDELTRKRQEAGQRGGKAKAKAQANASHVARPLLSKDVAESDTESDTEKKKLAARKRADARRGSRLPDDWKPGADLIEAMRAEGIPDDVSRRELPRFRDYWLAQPGAKGVKLDWDATWRNWLRRATEDVRVPAPRREVPTELEWMRGSA